MGFVTDSNRPQPLWQPPPTTCLTASGATSDVPSLLIHPCPWHPLQPPSPPKEHWAIACVHRWQAVQRAERKWEENGRVSGPQDHRYLSVTKMRHKDHGGGGATTTGPDATPPPDICQNLGCEATDTQLPYDPRDTGHRSSPTTLFCCTAALFVHRHSIVRRSPHSALPMAPISCTDTAWASSLSCPHLIPLKCGTPPSSLSPCHTSQAFPAVPTPPRYPALIFVS